jgi:hypothetical protein
MDVESVVELCVPKDAVRKVTKWGPADGYKERVMRDITTNPSPANAEWMSTFDTFVGVHTGYYYQMEEVCALLQHKPGSVLHLLMHRFSGETGTMNLDEQTWKKVCATETLTEVEQTNVLTGEKYVHPDNAAWFNTSSWAPPAQQGETGMQYHAGIAWTTQMVGPETFHFIVTGCPGRVVANDPTGVRRRVPEAPRADAALAEIQRAGACSVDVNGASVKLVIDAPHTYHKARMLVAGKPRSPKRFADHLATVKRIAAQNKEASGNMFDVALASYFADFDRDRALNKELFSGKFEEMRELETVMSGKCLDNARNLFSKACGLAVVVLAHSRSPGEKLAGSVLSHLGNEIG